MEPVIEYTNTGYARYKTLTVSKGTYTQAYDLCAGFTFGGITYLSLSDDGFARLSDSDYEQRRDAFINYVCSLEEGLATDCPDMADGSVEYNTTTCPISTPSDPSSEERE
jgi:hypothetical protein